jgi:hypothetical protein
VSSCPNQAGAGRERAGNVHPDAGGCTQFALGVADEGAQRGHRGRVVASNLAKTSGLFRAFDTTLKMSGAGGTSINPT